MRNWLRRAGSPIALGAFLLGMTAASGQTPATPTNEKFLKRTSAWELTGSKPRPTGEESNPAETGAVLPAAAESPVSPPAPVTPPGLPLTPTPHITANAAKYIKQLPGPENTLEVVVGRIQNFALLQTPGRIQVGDETIANTALLSPREVTLQGLRVGTTVLNIWFKDEATGKSEMVGFLVRVLPDPDARGRLERAYKNLEREVNKAFPNSRVYLTLVGDKLTVYGQARDIAESNMIMRMVQSNILQETADAPDLGRPGTDPSNYNRVIPAYHRQVVNMLRVIGEQQVMLQVQVVEVNRAAARSIGLNFGAFRNAGSFFVGGTTGNLGLNAAGFTAFNVGQNQNIGLTGLGGVANLPVALDQGQIQLAIAALRNLSYARYLAEPNLVAINGQTANFQAGSLLPVPVITGGGNQFAGNLQGVNFVPLGVQLAFTPFITDRDRVRLTINAEISDRDTNVVPTIIDGAAIPSLVTRNFNTTVELREGQTLAVAGLIESKLDNDSNRLPFIWHIPVLNRIAGYDRIGNREKELVILVTPRLVRPLECQDVPPVPGVDLLEPTDFEFYVLGRMESHTGSDFRSPVRTDKSRKCQQFRFMEHTMLIGPSGPTHDLPGSVDAPMPNKILPKPSGYEEGKDILPSPSTPGEAPMGQLPASLSGLEGGAPVSVTPVDNSGYTPLGGRSSATPGSLSSQIPPKPTTTRWNK
jgi:pilus assembly protein CpaC